MGDALSLVAMVSGDFVDFAAGSRNGFLETGRGDGSSKGEAGLLGMEFGEAALFLKGLLEDRLRVKPGALPIE